ncbi:hypothetical protein [Capnocytophaga cynodegmi]|uniref:Uncharacterized protein n=1 Tax=Capnocytophaga cynodegmi TaxID=28189 RepID=A0A0B7H8T8_9FLAO|nr:hypothetical protein [Capnocytophaga cynodegmi]CEN35715.1 hypothetical protein CCYN2B_280032 [Capnocytophaga cynodegmi]
MFEEMLGEIKLIMILSLILLALSLIVPKIMKRADREEVVLMIVLFFSVSGLLVIKKFQDDEFYRLTDNYAITKGYIESYFVGGKVSIPTMGVSAPNNSVEYSYFIGNDFYVKKYSEPGRVEIPDIKPDLSADYIVIYEKTNPENSFILLNYPVKDDIQFKEYQKVFEKTIPDNVFKNYEHENE